MKSYFYMILLQELLLPLRAIMLVPIIILTRMLIYNIVCVINGYDWHYDLDPDIPECNYFNIIINFVI